MVGCSLQANSLEPGASAFKPEKQESIPVGCVPLALVAVSWGVSAWRVSAQVVSAWGVSR